MKNTIQIYLTHIMIVFIFSTLALSQLSDVKKNNWNNDHKTNELTMVELTFIDPGISPFSGYRWRDVAGNLYSDIYRTNYGYDNIDVNVEFTFEQNDATFHGQLSAAHLKPNFAYQLKISGFPGTASNELIGLVGRWWQEEWDGSQWTNGQNLNNKGDGISPNPNDLVYFTRCDEPDSTSPTGLKYRYTGYLVFDYFITDENGDAILDFESTSSYHVLWNTIQRAHTGDDGPIKSASFDPDPDQFAYDTDYPSSTMTIFGEWERLPVGEVTVAPGSYDCQIILTEESFHGWPGGSYTGQWAAAMGANIQFTIEEDDPLPIQLSSFIAESGKSCVFIRWITESEINLAGFEIFKSSHKENGYISTSDYKFNPDLLGHGNSSIKHEYLYIDHNVLIGQSYWYYLVDVALNGQRTFHGPVHVYVTDSKGLKYLSSQIPNKMILYPNFPNPFNSRTVIRFGIPHVNHAQNTITLAIYNSSGQKIRALYRGEISEGLFEIVWDGNSENGLAVSSGIYFVVLKFYDRIKTGKMILMR
jgi:hypothetical protein